MPDARRMRLNARYSGVTDVVVAMTRSCRRDSIPGAEAIIGPLINIVPLFVLLGLAMLVTTLIGAANPRLRAVEDGEPGTPVLEPSPAVASVA